MKHVKFKFVIKVQKMFIKGIFFFFLEIVCGYNIDVDFPIIFHHDDMFNNSYFGYTVHLYYESDIDTSW